MGNNDFTKEELWEIYSWGAIHGPYKYMSELGKIPLLDKVKRMIDHYCEHDCVNATYCDKCNKTAEI